MYFEFKQEHIEIQRLLRDFARKEILPTASERDENGEFPFEIIKKMAGLGLFGMPFPEGYGGSGIDYTGFVLAIEEIAAVDASVALTILAHTLCANHIFSFGSEEQKKRYLIPLATGEYLGAWALTEPSSGSDAGSLKTLAEKVGDRWIINGQKLFITNGSFADIIVLMARIEGDGISAFIVEKGSRGLRPSRILNKLGVRCSNTAEIFMENLEVPHKNLIGSAGNGFHQAMTVIDAGRIGISAMAVGIARASLDAGIKYAGEREQFGRAIAEFQAIQWMLSDMATEIDAARLLTLRAASIKDDGGRFTKEASMAKVFSSETAVRCATKAVQIHGGYGYIKEYPVERYFRDARICEIGEGTSEIQRLIIAREILKDGI